MGKITKKEYQERQKVLLEAIDEQKEIQKQIEKMFNDDDYSLGDKWNDAEDKIYDLEKELNFLDDEWDTRNWTGQDWNEWDLISNNID